MSLNLTAAGLADQKAWEAAGYALPSYDREAMITRTKRISVLGAFRSRKYFPCLPGKYSTGTAEQRYL